MKTLVLVDDDAEQRATIEGLFTELIDPSFLVRAIEPLPHIEDYSSFVSEEGVVGLVLDQRLRERQSQVSGRSVNYSGHQVVVALKPIFPELPIWILTSHATDDDVVATISRVRKVVPRREFTRSPKASKAFVGHIQSDANRYSIDRSTIIAELGALSEKMASGEATAQEQTRAKEIQTRMNFGLVVESISTQSAWLSQIDKEVKELQALRKAAEARIGAKKGKKK